MTINNVLLRRVEVTSEVTSIVLDNLPTTGYRDFYIVMSSRGNTAAITANYFVNFNDDSTGHSDLYLYGNGNGTTGSGTVLVNNNRLFIGDGNGNSGTADMFSNLSFYVSNYRSTGVKPISITSSSTQNAATAFIELVAGQYSGTSISKMTFTIGNGTVPFMRYTTVAVYGISTLGTIPTLAPYATGGDIIRTDGTYWYHAFTSSGIFAPQRGLTCNLLVVAGGGGGGRTVGGGGGAGGLLGFNSQTLSIQNYPVTVGAGGTGATAFNLYSANGFNSQFGSLTTAVGGGGAIGAINGAGAGNGRAGGSGGGGGGGGDTNNPGGSADPAGQGFAGGTSVGLAQGGGGGGGAGAVGGNAVGGTAAGTGGVGSSAYSSWGLATNTGQNSSGTVYFAGGGGGGSNSGASSIAAGAGGLGGGASGRAQASAGVPTAATPNTGGGGGGSGGNGDTANGGNGGSGIVIIRYPVL